MSGEKTYPSNEDTKTTMFFFALFAFFAAKKLSLFPIELIT